MLSLFFNLVSIPHFHNCSCNCCFMSRKNLLLSLKVISCLLTMNYCSVTCDCSFPCCEVVQHFHSSHTPLIFCWETGLWLLGISCFFLAFLRFWETLKPQDTAVVALQKSATWLQVTCLNSNNVLSEIVFIPPFTPKWKTFSKFLSVSSGAILICSKCSLFLSSSTIFILLESAVGKDLAFRWLKTFECKILPNQSTIYIYLFPDHDWKQKQLQTFIITRRYFFCPFLVMILGGSWS